MSYHCAIERLQCHPGKSGGHVFWCLQSVTECFQSVTDYLQPVTELETPKNMAAALPGMTLQPLYKNEVNIHCFNLKIYIPFMMLSNWNTLIDFLI